MTTKVNFYMVSPNSLRVVVTETDINNRLVGIAAALRQQ
jgi:hypothetical protein